MQSDLTYGFCKKHRLLIHFSSDGTATHISYTQNTALNIIGEAQRSTKSLLSLEYIDDCNFDAYLNSYFSELDKVTQNIDTLDAVNLIDLAEDVIENPELLDSSQSSPIIRFINGVISDAAQNGASDIHMEHNEDAFVIRYRIDGILRKIVEPDKNISKRLISRIKVMAKLDIAESRIPQDGKISLKLGGRQIDVRVSTLPAKPSERVVLRILDQEKGLISLEKLGLSMSHRRLFKEFLHAPHGIILVTGPTGSGKTTTLYSGLSEIINDEINILTIEDPIEYQLAGIGQMQVHPKAGLTFSTGLRAMLRQDPDVIMLGEIRDKETLDIAIQASLTGHLVISTLHTNSATGSISRLLDMGAEPFLISSSLLGIIAQRLVRQLCNECKVPMVPALIAELTKNYHYPFKEVYTSGGCNQCNNSGYKGRIGIFEFINIDMNAKSLISKQKENIALSQNLSYQSKTILHDGLEKVSSGATSLDEVLRVTTLESPIES